MSAETQHGPEDAQSAVMPRAADPPASGLAGPLPYLALSAMLEPPPRPGLIGVLGRFEILRVIGAGGVGIVFLARDTRSGQTVALKLLRPEFAAMPTVHAQFLKEAQRLQKLRHPNLVPVSEAGETDKTVFFVMPGFERGSLAHMLKPGVPLDTQAALQIALPLSEALQFVHGKGLIHRDIKPGNLLLGEDGAVCLADFGLARSIFNDSIIDVEREQCEGTAPYMSPAVAAGKAEDTRCDIYAFGAVLYEMLTGRPPYQSPTAKGIREQILAGPPRPIQAMNPKADPRLAQVAAWAMAREQRDRYSNMTDLAADLRRVKEGKPPVGPHGIMHAVRWPLLNLPRNLIGYLAIMAGVAAAVAVIWHFWPQWKISRIASFNSPQVPTWTAAETAEWNGVPGKELLVVENNDLLIFSGSGSYLDKWHCTVPGCDGLNDFLVSGAQPPGRDEALVAWTVGANLGLSLVNANCYELKRFTAVGSEPSSQNRRATSALEPLRTLRSEESPDGRPKVIAALHMNFGGTQRALCCFDYENQAMLWQQKLGPLLRFAQVLDLTSNGSRDMICGSAAPNNGYKGDDGSDDSHSYVFAFSSGGRSLWRTELGGVYSMSQPMLADLKGNGQKEIVVWVYSNEQEHGKVGLDHSRIVHLDRHGKVLEEYQTETCLCSCLLADLDHDSRTEVVCSDCEGFVHVLNPDLSLRRKERVVDAFARRPGSLDQVDIELIKAGDFGVGGRLHIVAQSFIRRVGQITNPGRFDKPSDAYWFENLEIRVLDAGMKTTARYPIAERATYGWNVKTADMDGDGFEEILSLSDHVDVLKLRRK
jgi:serine/threonine protein kinase